MSQFLDLIHCTVFDFIFLLRDNECTFGEKQEIEEILEYEQNETKIFYITDDTEITLSWETWSK